MKKIISVLLVLAMLFMCTACSNDTAQGSDDAYAADASGVESTVGGSTNDPSADGIIIGKF